MRKLTAVVTLRPGDRVEYWLNATVSVTSMYQHALQALTAKRTFDDLTPEDQRAFVRDLITENLRFS